MNREDVFSGPTETANCPEPLTEPLTDLEKITARKDIRLDT
jgi:hypothetical protein